MYAFVVLGLVFPILSQEIGLENVFEMTYFVSSVPQNLNSYQCHLWWFDTVECQKGLYTPSVLEQFTVDHQRWAG